MATQQGIWKPRQLDAALSFRTVYAADPSQRPYDDEEGSDGFLRYKWRGQDPNHPDNRALRQAMVAQASPSSGSRESPRGPTSPFIQSGWPMKSRRPSSSSSPSTRSRFDFATT